MCKWLIREIADSRDEHVYAWDNLLHFFEKSFFAPILNVLYMQIVGDKILVYAHVIFLKVKDRNHLKFLLNVAKYIYNVWKKNAGEF